MGEIVSLEPILHASGKAVRTEEDCPNRRKVAVLRHLIRPNSFARIESGLMEAEAGPFERALRLDEQGDERALFWYRAAIEAGDHAADAWCNLGMLESAKGWKHRAQECYESALRIDPEHFDAHYHLGSLFFDLGEINKAKVHYNIARQVYRESAASTTSETAGEYPPLLYQQARLLVLEQQYPEAIDALKRYAALVEGTAKEKALALLRHIREDVAMDGT